MAPAENSLISPSLPIHCRTALKSDLCLQSDHCFKARGVSSVVKFIVGAAYRRDEERLQYRYEEGPCVSPIKALLIGTNRMLFDSISPKLPRVAIDDHIYTRNEYDEAHYFPAA